MVEGLFVEQKRRSSCRRQRILRGGKEGGRWKGRPVTSKAVIMAGKCDFPSRPSCIPGLHGPECCVQHVQG
jgi:hypothetical protein